ncbi:zf-CSL-domain-containing protein [Mycena albidolilacea]|uniref:Diphthamide biosynthesis protein 3 n=1 Tax=Mycena albidolilacea TaxID=1033008 RepID=A0AAD7E7S8_9AGAR|nr:zf-CSL-domain-containing protein [Mycena albidolilacea]
MGAYYDEIEIEDMAWDEAKGVYHYPCPCGDRFEITRRQLADCEDIATCPSCSLIIRVIFDPLDFEDEPPDEEEESQSEEEEDGAESEEDHFEDAMEKLSLTSEAD